MTTVSSQVYYEASHLETEQVLFDGWVLAALVQSTSSVIYNVGGGFAVSNCVAGAW